MKGVQKWGYITARHLEVWRMAAAGMVNKEIADKLTISIKTVSKHRAELCRRLRVHSAVDLARAGYEYGVIELTPRGPLERVVSPNGREWFVLPRATSPAAAKAER